MVMNEAPRSKLRGITELNFAGFSEAGANPVASYGEYSSLCVSPRGSQFTFYAEYDLPRPIEHDETDAKHRDRMLISRAWLQEYNEQRHHQGRWCYGKTPSQTFKDSMPLAKEKMLAA